MFKIELIICIKMDVTLNNQQRLICHKNLPTNQPTNQGLQYTDSLNLLIPTYKQNF